MIDVDLLLPWRFPKFPLDEETVEILADTELLRIAGSRKSEDGAGVAIILRP
jgi:hypothetical protein